MEIQRELCVEPGNMGLIQTYFNRIILIKQRLSTPLAQTVLGIETKILHHIGNQAVRENNLFLGINGTSHSTTKTAA